MRPGAPSLLVLTEARLPTGVGPRCTVCASHSGLFTTTKEFARFFTGRPSAFINIHIDISGPPDFVIPHPVADNDAVGLDDPVCQCAFLRAMARIAHVIEDMGKIFSLSHARMQHEQQQAEVTIADCDKLLRDVLSGLPPYLHFFDRSRPRGHSWQEVQCAHIGLVFHLVRMTGHRPALLCLSLSGSSEAGSGAPSLSPSLRDSIEISMDSAKELIEVASDAVFERAKCVRNDASVANYIVSACVTLLFNVVNSAVTILEAKGILSSVERGILCLGQMEHKGPITGKALSMDIMKSAKDALALATTEHNLDQDLVSNFPWLR